MTDSDDPLAGADIGKTVTVEHETDLWLGAVPGSDVVRGPDRDADYQLADAEVVADEYGDRMLRVTVASDVTKQLPRNWDQEPREPTPEPFEGGSRLKRVGGLLLGAAISIGGAVALTQHFTGELAGETVTFGPQPTLFDLAPAVGAVAVLAALVVLAIQYLPRPGPRGGL
jgi:hypothetical protein